MEDTSDAALQASFAANAQQKGSLGFSGNFNISGNTQNITRFGWNAQNPSTAQEMNAATRTYAQITGVEGDR